MAEKTDRRVKYTKMVLRDSLTRLLKDKPVSRITIKELCDDADINRATFYAHYNDQYDLLKKIEQELIRDINSYLDSFVLLQSDKDSVRILTRIFEYIEQNADLCRVLLGKNGDIDFLEEIMMVVHHRLFKDLKPDVPIDQNTAESVFVFVATGSIGLIQRWLNQDRRRTSEEVATMIINMIKRGVGVYLPIMA